jgi:hypothetical protein
MITINPSSSVIIYVITNTNKQLLISESRDDLNRCTPWRRKPDQHATRFPHSVRVWSTTIRISCGSHIATFHTPSTYLNRSTTPKKKGFWHNSQHTGWSIRESVPSFSATTTHGAMGKSQASVDIWLLGLPDPYHRHTIGTFNACSRGPTHRSLTDTDGGYNLRGVSLSHTTPRPFQPVVSTFHLRTPPSLQFNQVPSIKQKSGV